MMLVSFYFECPTHGRFVEYLSTSDYPTRQWPKSIMCGFVDLLNKRPKLWSEQIINNQFAACQLMAERIPISDNFIQDSIGVSPAEDKHLIQMNKTYHSKSYLKRDLRSRGLSALTMEESRSIKSKTDDERHVEYLNRPDIARERRNNINEALNKFGVIDGLTEV